MSNRQDRWLVLLLCLNAVLLTAVVFSYVGTPAAHAQVRPLDYLIVPGALNESQQAVWIVDMGTQQLTTCIYDVNRQRIEVGQVLDISIWPLLR